MREAVDSKRILERLLCSRALQKGDYLLLPAASFQSINLLGLFWANVSTAS